MSQQVVKIDNLTDLKNEIETRLYFYKLNYFSNLNNVFSEDLLNVLNEAKQRIGIIDINKSVNWSYDDYNIYYTHTHNGKVKVSTLGTTWDWSYTYNGTFKLNFRYNNMYYTSEELSENENDNDNDNVNDNTVNYKEYYEQLQQQNNGEVTTFDEWWRRVVAFYDNEIPMDNEDIV
jgi:hypothetical protein